MLTASILAAAAICGGHNQVVVRQVPQQVIVKQRPQVLFLVGSEFRYNSFEERLEEIINRALNERLGGDPKSVAVQADAVDLACGKCHSSTDPKGELSLAGELTSGGVTQAIRRLASGEMPPDRVLTASEKNQVLQALLNREAKDEIPVSPTATTGSDDQPE